jgi:hypothetical protein
VDNTATAGDFYIFAVSTLALEEDISKAPNMNEPKKDSKSE